MPRFSSPLERFRAGEPSYARIIALAWPAALSGVAAPLLGVVDTWALGHSPNPLDIAAIALATLVFAFIYWSFSFLRISAAGEAAQAKGAGDDAAFAESLGRVAVLAGIMGVAVIAVHGPVASFAFSILDGSAEIKETARAYFGIRVWGAPAFLFLFAVTGWLTGQGRTGLALVLAAGQNVVNGVLDIWFVRGLGWGAEGVAAGTLIAEISGACLGAVFAYDILRKRPGALEAFRPAALFHMGRLRRTLGVNRDVFIRTIGIVFAFSWFTNQGARQGDLVLAGNQILLQFFMVSSFALDGAAIAGEALVGEAIGSKSRARYITTVRRTAWATVAAGAVICVVYALFGNMIIEGLTADTALQDQAKAYLPWAIALPLYTAGAFHLDGVFVGASRGRDMRNAMVISVALYLGGWALLQPLGNHGLWAAFALFFLVRWATLYTRLPGVRRDLF